MLKFCIAPPDTRLVKQAGIQRPRRKVDIGRDRLAMLPGSAEGATAPETLRQKDRYHV